MLDVLAGPEPGDSIVPPLPRRHFPRCREGAPEEAARCHHRGGIVRARRCTPTASLPCGAPPSCARALGTRSSRRRCRSTPRHWVTPCSRPSRSSTAIRLDDRARMLGRALRDDEVEPVTRRTAELGRTISGATYSGARAIFDQAAVAVARLLSTYDVFLSPVLAAPPVVLGELGLQPAQRERVGHKGRWPTARSRRSPTRRACRLCRCRCIGTRRDCRSA